jgi:hypothetical protein
MGDFDNVEISFEEPSSTIPEGIYTVEISNCEKKTSEKGNQYLALQTKVVGEKFAGWILRDNFNLWFENKDDKEKQEMVREIAGRQFGRLLKALGMDKAPDNASALNGRKVQAVVGIEASTNPDYPGDNNIIEDYKAVDEDVPDWVNETSDGDKPKKPSL